MPKWLPWILQRCPGIHPNDIQAGAHCGRFCAGMSCYICVMDCLQQPLAHEHGLHGDANSMKQTPSPMQQILTCLVSFQHLYVSAECLMSGALYSTPEAKNNELPASQARAPTRACQQTSEEHIMVHLHKVWQGSNSKMFWSVCYRPGFGLPAKLPKYATCRHCRPKTAFLPVAPCLSILSFQKVSCPCLCRCICLVAVQAAEAGCFQIACLDAQHRTATYWLVLASLVLFLSVRPRSFASICRVRIGLDFNRNAVQLTF